MSGRDWLLVFAIYSLGNLSGFLLAALLIGHERTIRAIERANRARSAQEGTQS